MRGQVSLRGSAKGGNLLAGFCGRKGTGLGKPGAAAAPTNPRTCPCQAGKISCFAHGKAFWHTVCCLWLQD